MERLEQGSYTIYAALEKLLPTAIDKQNLDKSTLKLLEDNWTDEVNTSIWTTEMVIWKQIFIDVTLICFPDIISHLRILKKGYIINS